MAGTAPDRIALTGATGFVGGRLLERLLSSSGTRVSALLRDGKGLPAGVDAVRGALADAAALDRLCAGADTVFHCAGYAHAMDDGSEAFADAHWQVNFEGTRNLVEAAGRAGVKRFVHLSSVKAMAEPGAACVDEDWPGEPASPYGKAKRAAEAAALEAGADYGMHVVNLRLAMVYGPGSRRGNLDRMASAIRRGWFPPLPETSNRRSLVYVDDVVAAILRVACDSRANGRTYIVAEDAAYSGRSIYELLCEAMGIRASVWSVPAPLLRVAGASADVLASVMGRSLPIGKAAVDRLLESAWYSARRIERELGWQAEVSLPAGLAKTYGFSSC